MRKFSTGLVALHLVVGIGLAMPAYASKKPSLLCDASKTMGLCYAFTGKANAEGNTRKGNEMACKMFKGKFSKSATCPSSSLMGACKIEKGKPDEYVLHYYDVGRLKKAGAKKDCKDPKSSIHAQGAGIWSDK